MKPRLHVVSSSLLLAAFALAVSVCKPRNEVTPRMEPPPAVNASAETSAPVVKDYAHAGKPAEAAAAPAGVNPVQNEMRILHEAAQDWVTAVANNTLHMIPVSIGKVHEARMLTEKAVAAGAYRPPKNGDALADFAKQDDAFHAELVTLLNASKGKDLPGTTKQLGVVLQSCTGCHLRFRF